ncbi:MULTISPECIES: DsbA family oxidoreductase [unclassified Wenzhouxiangella]|uniref:DsbA family oxidoreductase n=1 Tax=unclassified Wenzhouxiangella TaxID=2613841 RepID=UPI0015F29B42|nr:MULTISPECIES: DsbA family oxidoreductase [unclassified Wenzhouxiangella]
MSSVNIEIWSDIACPWCWIGKRSLEAAIASSDHEVALRWRAFELNPDAPADAPEAVDYVARLADKYGTSRDEAEAFIARMVEAGRGHDLEIRFDWIRPSNTFDAHRLLAFAYQHDRQTELKEKLFQAYLHEGRSISDPDTLLAIAIETGLAGSDLSALLDGTDYAEDVRNDEDLARKLGITGVPCFVFTQLNEGISGAQPPEVLGDAMNRAAQR